MPLPGGHSNKIGDRYENWAVVYHMVDVLQGRLSSICAQSIGDTVDDFVTTGVDAAIARRYHQVKSQCASGQWTLKGLRQEGVLDSFVSQLERDPMCECCLVSGVAANELKDLSDYVRSSPSLVKFKRDADTGGLLKRFQSYCDLVGVSESRAFEFLKRTHVSTIDEGALRKRVLDFGDHFAPGKAPSVADCLFLLACERLNQEIDQDAILCYLDTRGFCAAAFVQKALPFDTPQGGPPIAPEAGGAEFGAEWRGRIESKIDLLVQGMTPIPKTGNALMDKQLTSIKGLIGSGRYRTARRLLEVLTSDIEGSPSIVTPETRAKLYTNLAVCADHEEDAEAVIRFARSAYDLQPRDPGCQANWGHALCLSGKAEEALALADASLAEAPHSVALVLAKAQALCELRRLQEATVFLEAYAPQCVGQASIHRALAQLHLSGCDYGRAIAEARQAVQLEPRERENRFALANACAAGATEEARSQHFLPWFLPASVEEALKEAEKLLTELIGELHVTEWPERYVACLTNRAAVRIGLSKDDHAREDLELALSAAPNSGAALRNRALLSIQAGRLQEACDDLRRAIEASPEAAELIPLYAETLLHMGNATRALEALDTSKSVLVEEPRLALLRARIEDSLSGGRTRETECLESQVASTPGDWHPRLLLAHVYASSGRHDDAQRLFEEARSLIGEATRPEAELSYASFLVQIGKVDEALALYAQFTPSAVVSPYLRQYLDLLLKREQHGRCYEVICAIPDKLQQDTGLLDLRAQLAESLGRCQEAAQLWRRLGKQRPESARNRVHLAVCQFRLGQRDAAQKTLRGGQSLLTDASPEDLMLTAKVYKRMGDCRSAICTAYQAAVSRPGDSTLAVRYAILFLMCDRDGSPWLRCESVEPGVVVDVSLDGKEMCWFLRPEGTAPSPPPNAHPIDHPTVIEALKGKRAGELFEYQSDVSGGTVRGAVVRVRTPYVKLLNDTLESMEYLAPDAAFLRKVDVSHDFEVVRGMLVGSANRGRLATKLYKDHRVPVSMLAHLLGRSIWEVVWTALNYRATRLEIMPGLEDERLQDEATWRAVDRPVVDPMTLAVLTFFESLSS